MCMDEELGHELLSLENQDPSPVPDENLSAEVSNALGEIEAPEHWHTERPGWEYNEDRNDLEQWILTGALDAESILAEKGINPENRKIMIGYDYDGPINTPYNESMEAPEGFHDARKAIPLHHVDWLGEAIISGRDIDYLKDAIHNSIGLDAELAGQHGAVYMPSRSPVSTASKGTDIKFLKDNPRSEFDGVYEEDYSMPDWDERILFESASRRRAAEENKKLIWATSRSPVAGTMTIEGEGVNLDEERTDLWGKKFFSENYAGTTISELYENIKNTAEDFDKPNTFEKNKDKIKYSSTEEDEEILSYVLSVEEPFTELRFDTDGEKIMFEVDTEAEEDYGLWDADHFVNSITETVKEKYGVEFGYDRNPDWWFDFYLESDISKDKASQAILENPQDSQYSVKKPSDALFTYIGDREGDVLTLENSLDYVQIGEDSHRHCFENDIPAVLANVATDYLLMSTEVFHRNKDDYEM